MKAGLVRGACPGLSAPMQTGDGLLVRLTPRGSIAVDAFIDLCALARRQGNGQIEVTARGNLQVRGLTAQSAPLFAAAVTGLEIASTCPVPLITDPLPQDPDVLIDVAHVAAGLSQAVGDLQARLAAKISIALDGGSRLHLDALAADIRLRAVPSAKGPRLHVALGGDARSATMLGTIAPNHAGDVAARLLEVIARHGPTARATDVLRHAGIAPFRTAVAEIEPASARPARPAAEPIGLHPLRERLALGVALAFGQAEAAALAQLASVARRYGATALRPAPGRALLLLGLDESGAANVTRAAEQLGFITRADDPRRRIAACAGKPACASAYLATRALAAAIAPRLPRGRGEVALHISGCPKGCAHPGPAALTIVGEQHGAGIVRNGPASVAPSRHVAAADLLAEVAQLMQISEAQHG